MNDEHLARTSALVAPLHLQLPPVQEGSFAYCSICREEVEEWVSSHILPTTHNAGMSRPKCFLRHVAAVAKNLPASAPAEKQDVTDLGVRYRKRASLLDSANRHVLVPLRQASP